MCEYCGCQSVPAIGELASEHERAMELAVQARAAHRDGDLAWMAHLAQRIADLLAAHFAVEEQGLFPVLEAEFPEQIAALRREHAALTAILAGAGGVASWDCSWATRLLGALDLLQWHILKEQDGVFPAALATLHTADWQALDAVRDRIGAKQPHSVGA
ncbi:MAG TPA: hemerythrin domain-containing protein [Actinocrinis sp.]|nr:hemerythrin domain-containing protein [Actinocrinis sp.]